MNDLLNYNFFYLLFFLLGFFLATIIFKLFETRNKYENNDPSDWWKKGKDPFDYE